jgi:uncharacterized iron-regulated membrane protein
MRVLGIILIALGIIMMIITGVNVVTQKNVVDLGALQIDKRENSPVSWSPIVGGVLLVAGVVIVVAGNRRRLA